MLNNSPEFGSWVRPAPDLCLVVSNYERERTESAPVIAHTLLLLRSWLISIGRDSTLQKERNYET